MIKTDYLEVEGVRTYCRFAGSGEAVLLLHGLGASSYSWRKIIPELSKRFTVITPDWPGYGRSDQPRDFDYSLTGYSRWLAALLDKLAIKRANLVGNSMGGVVSLFTALDNPERVLRMALIGTPTYVESRPKLLWPMRWPVIGRIYERSIGPWAVGMIARSAFVDWSLITPEMVDEYSIAIKGPEGRRAIAQFIRNAVPPDAASYLRRYKTIKQPTLVIVGEKDFMVNPAAALRFSDEVPGASFISVAECGHAPQEEKPEPVLRALLEFLRS